MANTDLSTAKTPGNVQVLQAKIGELERKLARMKDEKRRLELRDQGLPEETALPLPLPSSSKSEEMYLGITDASFNLNRDWRFTYLNSQAEIFLGKKREELLGKIAWEEFPEAVGTNFNLQFQYALDHGIELAFEDYYPPLKTWFRVNIYPSPEGLSVYFNDISQRKRDKEALEEQLRLAELTADLSQTLAGSSSLQAMLMGCTEALVRHLEVAFARIWTLNQDGTILELKASSGMYTHLDGPHSRVPVGSFKIGMIAKERKPHLTNQVVGDLQVANQEWARREGMVSFAGYPLIFNGTLVGVIAMFSRRPLGEGVYRAMESVVKQVSLGVERNSNETELREQRERYAVTLSSIGDAVIATDVQGRVTFLNPVAQELTGWSDQEAEGQELSRVFEIVNMNTLLKIENPVNKVLELGSIVGLANHTLLISKDGRRIPIEDSAAPIKISTGEVIGVVLVFRDVSEKQLAQAEHNRLLEEVQKALQAQKELDKLKDQFLSIAGHELRTPLTAIKGYTQLLQKSLNKRRASDLLEESGRPPVDAGFTPDSRVDLDMLPPSRERQQRLMTSITRQVGRMVNLIDEMLDVTRIQNEKLKLNLSREADLAKLVERVVEEQIHTIDGSHNLFLNNKLDSVLLSFDEGRIEQVLNNLINNAIKYSPKGTEIEVGTGIENSSAAGNETRLLPPEEAASPPPDRSDAGWNALVWVRDHGPGVTSEEQLRIFDQFYRIQGDKSSPVDGLGLGLYISFEIILRHGGKMWVESTMGQGCTFYFSLPLPLERSW